MDGLASRKFHKLNDFEKILRICMKDYLQRSYIW